MDDDDQAEADDMADLKKKIDVMEQGTEERKMGVREWRRLRRIPAGSVENGVIRTYVSPSPLFSHPHTSIHSSVVGVADLHSVA